MNLKFSKSFLWLIAATGLLLLASCSRTSDDATVPVTTQSESARELFLDGRNLYENLRIGEARELFDLAIDKDPLFAQAHLYRFLTPRSLADGQKRRRHAVSLVSKVSTGERLLIEALAGEGREDSDRAISLLQKLTQMYPDDKRAHLFLGRLYHFNTEDRKGAIREYKRAIRIDKNFAPPYNLMGYMYSDMGKYRDAEKALKNYIRLIPDEPNPYDSMADLLTRQGQLEEANEFFARAFEVNPLFTISQQKLGVNLIFLGQYDEGRAAIRVAFDHERDNRVQGVYLMSLSQSYLYEGDVDGALESLEDVSDLAREADLDQLLLQKLAFEVVILMMDGQFENVDALQNRIGALVSDGDYEDIVLKDLESGQTRLLILDKIIRREFDAALSMLEEYKTNVDDKESGYGLGSYHTMAGYNDVEMEDFEAALKHLEKGDTKEIDLFNMARAYEGLGKLSKAKEYYQKHTQLYTYTLWYALTLPQSRKTLARL